MNLIPTNKDTLKTWLVDLSGNIAVSGAGVAFLEAQITDLEKNASSNAPVLIRNAPMRR